MKDRPDGPEREARSHEAAVAAIARQIQTSVMRVNELTEQLIDLTEDENATR